MVTAEKRGGGGGGSGGGGATISTHIPRDILLKIIPWNLSFE